MPVIRVEKNKNYTIMSNYHLQDRTISLKAKGLLSYMLSLPENWDYSIAGLSAICKEGVDCIRSTIGELEEHGYVTKERERLENGQLGGTMYTVREKPENTDMEKPILENPTQGFPTKVNQTQINKYNNNDETKKTNIEKKESQSKIYKKEEATFDSPGLPELLTPINEVGQHNHIKTNNFQNSPQYRPDWFERFWNYYPNKICRMAAMQAWDAIRPDAELCAIMKESIDKWKKTKQWKEKGMIPSPDKWLRDCRWTDEPPKEYDPDDKQYPDIDPETGLLVGDRPLY